MDVIPEIRTSIQPPPNVTNINSELILCCVFVLCLLQRAPRFEVRLLTNASKKGLKYSLTNTKPHITLANSTHLNEFKANYLPKMPKYSLSTNTTFVFGICERGNVYLSTISPPSCQYWCVNPPPHPAHVFCLCVCSIQLSPQHLCQEATMWFWLCWQWLWCLIGVWSDGGHWSEEVWVLYDSDIYIVRRVGGAWRRQLVDGQQGPYLLARWNKQSKQATITPGSALISFSSICSLKPEPHFYINVQALQEEPF